MRFAGRSDPAPGNPGMSPPHRPGPPLIALAFLPAAIRANDLQIEVAPRDEIHP